jgi:hypothetical protein
MRCMVTIREGRTIHKEVSITVPDHETAKEWGNRQAAAMGVPEAQVVVMEDKGVLAKT